MVTLPLPSQSPTQTGGGSVTSIDPSVVRAASGAPEGSPANGLDATRG